MNIWKIASRWSDDGNKGSSILDLFRKYKIAFVYDGEMKNKVKKGDTIAISSGFQIVAVAKAIQDGCKITDIKNIEEEDKERFEYSDNVSAVRLNIYDLDPDECIEYKKIGRFHSVNQNREKITEYYEKYHTEKQFSIKANTYNLKGGDKTTSIINDEIQYIIPIYQRPYSWGETEVSKFIRDIFISYWGYEKKIESQEPMFIGTMQLSEVKSEKNQYIIDGQQRITTFSLLFKYLNLTMNDLKLKTEVNNGTQQILYDECINLPIDECMKLPNLAEENNNQYIKNLKTIDSIFQEQIEDENFDVEKFSAHLLTNIFFVVIETRAGLSKTIQIFNAINTTGLDLNGGNIFKIRMYEYLTVIKEESNECFNEISELYEKIDVLNKEYKVNVDINQMLREYKDILISKYDMPNVLFELNANTFFDRLFDTILGNQKWNNFSKASSIELSIQDLDRIIENRFKWQAEWENFSDETKCIYHFLRHSRYSKYWNFIFVYWFKKGTVDMNELNHLHTQLNKLFFLYSVTCDRVINNVKSFIYKLYKNIYNEDDKIIESIDKKIKEKHGYDSNKDSKEKLEETLSNNIFYNAKKKNLICRLSALLEGDKNFKMLFEEPIDIEHIQPQTDDSKNANDWDLHLHLKNSIGNLTILERNLNRAISNDEKKKAEAYKTSKYKIVQKLSDEKDYSFKNWSVDECKKRLEIEKNKITDYIFS